MRHARVRARISGTTVRPRLAVFRSNRATYAQIIDDTKGVTLVASSDLGAKKGTKAESAKETGVKLGEAAKKKGITAVVFDRAGYKFHGRIKALAEGARESGLQF